VSAHVEFPFLTPEARATLVVGIPEAPGGVRLTYATSDRRRFAAFPREAMKQAHHAHPVDSNISTWEELGAIADNLHSPPPPPPTLAEAREAARQLAGPSAEIVHAFLPTLEVP
jgi:hypothetical protein